ncbi:hypothetical protein VTI74DRAFT_11280 [Chaetomium olivicolor]
MACSRSLLLPIGLLTFLLSVDAAISLGLVSSMVAFLHSHGRGPFLATSSNPAGSTFLLYGEPANLATNHGHTTNGAGGTALVLVGFGGIVALWLERRSRKTHGASSPIFHVWSLLVLLSALLTLGALIYTFVETSLTSNQLIDLAVAEANPPPARYPEGRWTPETWYAALLELPLVSADQRGTIRGNLTIMRAWRWNLVPLFVLGFGLVVLVAVEVVRVWRREGQDVEMVEALAEGK